VGGADPDVYFVVIGVTGSILVFRPELERLCRPKPSPEARAQGPNAEIDRVIENLKAAYPERRIASVDAPSETDATFVAVLAGRGGRIKVACRALRRPGPG
jgi:uncharacterized iron-regulated membrane protein